MKLESKFFDSIRISKPGAKKSKREEHPQCTWEGCEKVGSHRAPIGRGREGEYRSLCLEHVRAYNKSYNYFSGMDDGAIADFQKDSRTGHRPTWNMGVNKSEASAEQPKQQFGNAEKGAYNDPFGLFGHGSQTSEKRSKKRPAIKKLDKRALDTLGLAPYSDAAEIKSRYKQLVKKHHPDANGGDRGSEERLQQIIAAYNQLKKSGLSS